MFTQENTTFTIQILLAVGMLLSTASLIVSTFLVFHIKKTLYKIYCDNKDSNDKIKEIYYSTRKMCENVDDTHRLLTELSESLSNIYTAYTEYLSDSSNSSTTKRSTLPTPELEEQITATIKDQIATEVSLSSGLRAPYADSLRDIVYRTASTYPDVDLEYLVRKVVSMVEMYSK